MAIFLNTRGRSKIAIAICARCSVKYPYDSLSPDPNAPGLMCCPDGCLDQFDPYRLPAAPTENITLQHARPDVSLSPGPMNVYARELQAMIDTGYAQGIQADSPPPTGIAIAPPVQVMGVSQPWTASTFYPLGAQVTETNPVGTAAAGNLFSVFICIVPGVSGATAPSWNEAQGSEISDGSAIWINGGLFLE